MPVKFAIIGFSFLLMFSCQETKKPRKFKKLEAKDTGIEFSNQLTETPFMNIFNYMYFYNGGGLAVALFSLPIGLICFSALTRK